MDCSIPGFLILHSFPEFAQTHVHWVSQWCHPTICRLLLLPSVFPSTRVFFNELAQVAKVLEFKLQPSVLPTNIQGWFPLGLTGLISSLSKGLWRVFSNTTTWNHQFFVIQPSLWFNSYISHDYWKNHSFDYSFVSKVMSLLFNMLSRFVIAFFPRSNHHLGEL